ncbi:MAG: type II toxin-antitoxin system prevent-host-death family antitoxin [Nitrospira sp.]|nr:type II toxin-antitoxin system prevent-host-death family antitoxin [Nitrospira sp.]
MKAATRTVNVHEAKTHCSKLLAAVAKGQRITICKAGTPVAELGPLETNIPVRRPGLLKGRIGIADDFDAPLPTDMIAVFERGRPHPYLISDASLWEVVIKVQMNKLSADPAERAAKIADSGFQELPVSVLHTLALERLPLHHRDPFDRILLAQAQVEQLRLLAGDASLKPYGPVCQVLH